MDDIFIKDIVCGVSHILALSENGTLYSGGDNAYGQLGRNINQTTKQIMAKCDVTNIGNDISSIFAGTCQSYVIDVLGKLWVFGDNENNNITLDNVLEVYSPLEVKIDEEVVLVSGTDKFSLIKTMMGDIYVISSSKGLKTFSAFTEIQNKLAKFTQEYTQIVGYPSIPSSSTKSARK